MTKAVIFDLDGLLIDSEPYWEIADKKLLKRYGYDLPKDIRMKLHGRGQKECAEIIIDNFGLDETIDSFIEKRLDVLYGILLKELKLMPFAKELAKNMRGKGCLIALATGGHKKEAVEKILERLSVLDLFDEIVSGFEVKRGKPYPDIYIETAQRFDILPKDCVVLEDSVNGVEAGKSAGCFVIGVNKDRKIREELKEAQADRVFVNLKEVNTFLLQAPESS